MSSSKKARTKPPRGRPQSTSALSQPLAQDVASSSTLCSFSPSGAFFVFLFLAVDKHRIRIYDTTSRQSVAEHILDSARVAALEWAHFDTSSNAPVEADDDPPRKRRKKKPSSVTQPAAPESAPEVVLLGLSDGTMLVYSPSHARVLRTLSHPSSSSPLLALDASSSLPTALTVWSSGADGSLRFWNVHQGTHISSTKIDDRIPCTAIRAHYAQEDEDTRTRILVAHHRIRLLSTGPPSSLFDLPKPKELAVFTGHASNVTGLQWQSKNTRHFASIAEADRHVHLWAVPEPATGEGSLVASLPLDADARCIAFAPPSSRAPLLALSASGRVAIFDVAAATAPKEKAKTTAVGARTNIRSPAKQGFPIVAAAFAEEGSLRIARLVGGVKPVFDVVRYLDDAGEYLPDATLSPVDPAAMTDSAASASGAPNHRFAESTSLAVGSGLELGQDATMDDLSEVGGDLDVDLAELSLGQRLTVLDPSARAHLPSQIDDEESEHEEADEVASAQTSVTLTRTLIQALHSSDTRLLESCLAHTRAELVLNTVRRLPPQLALPLLSACVERLGRGKRGSTGKGRGGGAGSQRAAGMVRWVKTVLVVHSGHLMTMPDLVARLAGLHATLTARMALQESLLALSGRLDMVLQQVELRGAAAPAPIASSAPGKGKSKGKGKGKVVEEKAVRRYVEGESEEEEGMEVDVEEGSSEGSVEDVELGGESGSEVDEDYDEEDSEGGEESGEDGEEDSEDDEDDEGDEGGPRLNGFIDDEAEESEDEGSESE